MTTPTPPAVTADGLAAALRLLDFERARVLSGAIQAAVFAVARAAVADQAARDAFDAKAEEPGPWSQEWSDEMDALSGAYGQTTATLRATVADLAALATATGHATATAGEGAS